MSKAACAAVSDFPDCAMTWLMNALSWLSADFARCLRPLQGGHHIGRYSRFGLELIHQADQAVVASYSEGGRAAPLVTGIIGGCGAESVASRTKGATNVCAGGASYAGQRVRSSASDVHGLTDGVRSQVAGVRHRRRGLVDLDGDRHRSLQAGPVR